MWEKWLLVSEQSSVYLLPWSTSVFAISISVALWFKQQASNTRSWWHLRQPSIRLFQSESELKWNLQFQQEASVFSMMAFDYWQSRQKKKPTRYCWQLKVTLWSSVRIHGVVLVWCVTENSSSGKCYNSCSNIPSKQSCKNDFKSSCPALCVSQFWQHQLLQGPVWNHIRRLIQPEGNGRRQH